MRGAGEAVKSLPPARQLALEVRLDREPVAKRIGVITLATDHTTERDFARVCDPDAVGIYVGRIAYDNPTTIDNLRSTGPRLTAAAAGILPDERLDVVAYSCTAASVVLGDAAIAEAIKRGKPNAKSVTPPSAALAAFEALGVERISLLTPYTPQVTDALVGYFSEHGLSVVNAACLGFEDDRRMARIDRESIASAAAAAVSAKADALFISCTALRAFECVAALEGALAKPVVTSNQAQIWHSLRLAGMAKAMAGYGRLFTL